MTHPVTGWTSSRKMKEEAYTYLQGWTFDHGSPFRIILKALDRGSPFRIMLKAVDHGSPFRIMLKAVDQGSPFRIILKAVDQGSPFRIMLKGVDQRVLWLEPREGHTNMLMPGPLSRNKRTPQLYL